MKRKIIAFLTLCAMIANLCCTFGLSASAEDTLIFKTDFDSYQIGSSEAVQSALEALPYADGNVFGVDTSNYADKATGAQLDAEHGKSLHFTTVDGDWPQVKIQLPQSYSKPVLISFDVNFQEIKTYGLKVFGNSGINFGMNLIGTNYVNHINYDNSDITPNVIEAKKWQKVEIYVDSENAMQIVYIDGTQVGKVENIDWGWGCTPLESIQFDQIFAGDVYVDNVEIKKVTDVPYHEDITASIASDKVNSEKNFVKLNFSNEVNTETVTTENIKVCDVEAGNYLSGVTLENITGTSADIKFSEKLTVGKSYRIDIANVKGKSNENVTPAQIPFEVFEGDENNIFKTDFSSYIIGNGDLMKTEFNSMPYAIAEGRTEVDKMVGAQLDAEHGTSMRLSEGDWLIMSFNLGAQYSTPVLVSLDLNVANTEGNRAIRILANNGNNFGIAFNNENYIGEGNHEAAPTKENAIGTNEWHRIEVYVDSANDKQITYIDGKQVGGIGSLGGEKTPLDSIQIQKVSGDMYVDNVEVKQVTDVPYHEDITASIVSDKVNSEKNFVKLNFSNEVNTETVTTENIKVYDIEAENYLSGVTLENITGTSADIKFSEKLTVGKSYRIDIANVKGKSNENVTPAQIPFEVFAGDKDLIFKTDFSSYIIGNGDLMNSNLTSLPYADGKVVARANGEGVSGVKSDEKYGISLKFDSGEWRNISFDLPDKYSTPVLVSFDFNMTKDGVIKILGNNGDNFGMNFNGENYIDTTNIDAPATMEHVISMGVWHRFEIFSDAEHDIRVLFIDGKQIGGTRQLEGEKTPLESIQFQKVRGGDMYMDNFEVTKVEKIPEIGKNILEISEDVENVTASYDADITEKEVTAYLAAYSKDNVLIEVKSEKSYNGILKLAKNEEAVLYKAFLWGENNEPLCKAKELTVASYNPSEEIYFDFADNGGNNRLNIVSDEDIVYETKDGKKCAVISTDDEKLVFDIDDSVIKYPSEKALEIQVEYYDEQAGYFALEYDGVNGKSLSEPVLLDNSKEWKTHTFRLYDAPAGNGYDSGDFAVVINTETYEKSPSPLLLGKVSVKKLLQKPVDIKVSSKRAGNIFVNGEGIKLDVAFKNIVNKPLNLAVRYTAKDIQTGETMWSSNTDNFEIDAEGSVTRSAEFNLDKFGLYTLEIEATDSTGKYSVIDSYKFSYTKYNSDMPLNESFGTCTHFDLRDSAAVAPLIAASGIGYIRDEVRWAEYETSKGVFEMMDKDRTYLSNVENAGLDKLIILAFTNPLYQDKNTLPKTEEELEAFGQYCYNLVNELGDSCNLYEVWNEPNLDIFSLDTTPEAYVPVLKVAYENVKKANPNAIVLGDATAGTDPNYHKRVFELGGADYMDAVSFHPYYWFDKVMSQEDFYNSIYKVNELIEQYKPSLKMVATESGWPLNASPVITQYIKRDNFLKEMTIFGKFPRMWKHFWYEFQDSGSSLKDVERNFGMVEYWEEKNRYAANPTFCAAAAYNAIIGDKKIIDQYEQDDTYVYRFDKNYNGNDTMMLWHENSAGSVSAQLGCDSVTVYDAYGNGTELRGNDGTFNFTLSDTPIMVEGRFNNYNVIEAGL